MNDYEPPGIIAPHIPADTYQRAQATGQPIVIVQHAPPNQRTARDYLLPLIVTLSACAGLLGTLAAVLALLELAANTAAAIIAAAGPIGVGGLTLRLCTKK